MAEARAGSLVFWGYFQWITKWPVAGHRPIALAEVFPYSESSEHQEQAMTIHLTPEQERRVQAAISRGAYDSVEQVVDAALVAVEQRTVAGFEGTREELETLLAEGLASKELPENEFWHSVNTQTNALLADHKTGPSS
jgi:Arc/MetJ-type ribon-helix-helix transcriptional regulator